MIRKEVLEAGGDLKDKMVELARKYELSPFEIGHIVKALYDAHIQAMQEFEDDPESFISTNRPEDN